MKQPTPPQSVNGIVFTEDDLTGAIFNNATLTTTGQCTKQEARQAARMMLAAPKLLNALKSAFEIMSIVDAYYMPDDHNSDPARLREAIRQAHSAITNADAKTGELKA